MKHIIKINHIFVIIILFGSFQSLLFAENINKDKHKSASCLSEVLEKFVIEMFDKTSKRIYCIEWNEKLYVTFDGFYSVKQYKKNESALLDKKLKNESRCVVFCILDNDQTCEKFLKRIVQIKYFRKVVVFLSKKEYVEAKKMFFGKGVRVKKRGQSTS